MDVKTSKATWPTACRTGRPLGYLIMLLVHVIWSCHLIMLLVHVYDNAIRSCYLFKELNFSQASFKMPYISASVTLTKRQGIVKGTCGFLVVLVGIVVCLVRLLVFLLGCRCFLVGSLWFLLVSSCGFLVGSLWFLVGSLWGSLRAVFCKFMVFQRTRK